MSANIFDDFDYIPNEEDLESIAFAESITSESVIDSIESNNDNNVDIEIPFLFNNINFEKARELVEEDENDDVLLLRDIDENTDIDTEADDSKLTSSIFDSESIILGLTEGSEYNIADTTDESLSKCPIIDLVNGTTQCCSNHSDKQRPLSQLIGSWEIDSEIFQNAQKNNNLPSIGVCYSHFLYDQNQLHASKIKQERTIEKSWIFYRRCLFCNKSKHFFSRGNTCIQHSNHIFGKNIQIPCTGLKVCPIFRSVIESENNKDPEYRPRYICSECFIMHGGHFFERKGRGNQNFECIDLHKNDTNEALKIIGQWILSMSEITDENKKNNLLACLTNMISTFFNNTKSNTSTSDASTSNTSISNTSMSNTSTIINYPSLMFIKIALRLQHIDISKFINQKYEITDETATDLGKSLGIATWKSRHDIQKNKSKIENPISLDEYRSSFPLFLTNFFNGFIETLQRRKHKILTKKRNQRGLPLKDFNISSVNKIVVFFISMVLNIAFPGTNVWLTHIMSSLCQKPKLYHSLYNILSMANVVSHTYRYERSLEKIRQQNINPESRLLKGPFIWNIAVIDNIDFMERTYAYGNIFDATRKSVHATLRMVFQFTMPIELQPYSPINIESINKNNQSNIFGTSTFTDTLLFLYESTFKDFLTTYTDDNWNADEILKCIAQKIETGCDVAPPNVVILRPGDNPNSNVNIHNACDQYFEDVGIVNTECLDIACDEAIFRRLITYKENNNSKVIRPLLGQWHTSRDMCIVLINIFSGYGIANIAAKLGVKFLDKLEKVVDYQATCRVLELIWVAVGIAIFKYINVKKQTLDNIKNSDNNVIKVWYYYFCWAGYWIGHKIGIRRGNYDMQMKNLKAFSPLFPVAGKLNYARSVTYFLTYVENDSHLQELLKHVCSINLTSSGHYFAFDEALERFGVKYVKQNIGGKTMDLEELKMQISSVQTERERLDLLMSEFISDTVIIRNEKAIQSRKEVLWQLANELFEAFSLINPRTHELFSNAQEITPEGFSKIFTCYDLGINRLIAIQRQDVYKIDIRNTKGRRKRNIVVHKLLEKQSKEIHQQHLIVDSQEETTIQHKSQRRRTTDDEKKILEDLFKLDYFSEDIAIEILRQLQDISSDDWNIQRIRTYWNNHKKKNK